MTQAIATRWRRLTIQQVLSESAAVLTRLVLTTYNRALFCAVDLMIIMSVSTDKPPGQQLVSDSVQLSVQNVRLHIKTDMFSCGAGMDKVR